MKSLIIFSILLVLSSLFLGHISISIKPFSIALPYWHRSVGLILIVFGLILLHTGEYSTGYTEGLKKGHEIASAKFEQLYKELKDQLN